MVMDWRSSKTCLLFGLEFTGRMHLSEMASNSSIAVEFSSMLARSLSKQSTPLQIWNWVERERGGREREGGREINSNGEERGRENN